MTELIPLALTLLLAGGYLVGTRRLRRHGHRWPHGRTTCLMTGTLCVASALLPPVSAHDELFGVHVLQHLLLGMAGPALLALSAPITLALRTAPPPVRHVLLEVLHSRPAAFPAAPAFAVTVNLGGLYALYLTHLYAAAQRSDLIHAAVHLHMFVAGCLLSWALIGTDPARRRSAVHVRVIVLVAAAAGHDFLSKFMYARDLPFGGGSLAARHFGAELMYYGGTLVDVALAVILMAQWYQSTGRALHREQRRSVHGAAAGPSRRGPRDVDPGRRQVMATAVAASVTGNGPFGNPSGQSGRNHPRLA
jgi:putative membrane protein